jgi:hypothetical protein
MPKNIYTKAEEIVLQCEVPDTNGMTVNECIERMRPRKVLVSNHYYLDSKGNFTPVLCPNCEMIISNLSYAKHVARTINKYCLRCGQRFDWSSLPEKHIDTKGNETNGRN